MKAIKASLLPGIGGGFLWGVVGVGLSLLALIPFFGQFISCCIGTPLCLLGLAIVIVVGYWAAKSYGKGKKIDLAGGALSGLIAGTLFGFVSSIVSQVVPFLLTFVGVGVGAVGGVDITTLGIQAGAGILFWLALIICDTLLGLFLGLVGGLIASATSK